VLEYKITTDPTIFRGEAKNMPSYSLGEKQGAGIKFERGHYYGKVIQSVDKSGRQRTTVEVLSEEWLENNMIESFVNYYEKAEYVYRGSCWWCTSGFIPPRIG
jgi:hypothetical protein